MTELNDVYYVWLYGRLVDSLNKITHTQSIMASSRAMGQVFEYLYYPLSDAFDCRWSIKEEELT